MTGDWLGEGTAALDRWIEEFVASGASPGAVAALGTLDGSRIVAHGAVVPHQGHQRPTASVSYDIASLTKVVATWPLTGLAVVSGELDLDEPVGTYFDQLSLPGAVVTTRHILSHTSGMAVRTRLDQYVGSGMDLAEHLLAEPLEAAPGTAHKYINRGFILLGLLLERITKQPLDVLASQQLWAPWGMAGTTYGPLAATASVAPTEVRLTGTRPAWGVVHDENAGLMGGVAGHAGVFSTVADLARFCRRLLEEDGTGSAFGWYLKESVRPHATGGDNTRGLAWLVSSDGRVIYHHGFTGVSLFLSLAERRFAVLLSNAVHCSRERRTVAGLQARLLELVSR